LNFSLDNQKLENPNAILIHDCNSRQAKMPPPKKPLKSVDDAKKGKNTAMAQYFKRKSLGRRPKADALCTDDVGVIVSGRKKRGPVPEGLERRRRRWLPLLVMEDWTNFVQVY
jgi:hypothetical protein